MATKSNNSKSSKNRPSNYLILTLKAIVDGEMKVSGNGKPYAFVRAFQSQGKDNNGEYKPSIFWDVKAFSKDEDVSPVVQAVADVANKGFFTVKGRIGMDEWTGNDGVKHQKMIIFASSIEPFSFDGEPAAEQDDELEGEPA